MYTEGVPSVWNFPNTHDQWQGSMPDTPVAFRALFDGVDVAALCGFSSQAPLAMFDGGAPLSPLGVKLIALSDNVWEVGKNQSVVAGIIGHVKLNLQALILALRATSQLRVAVSAASRRKSRLAELSRARRAQWAERLAADRERPGLTALSVAAALAAVMPPGAVFCDETVSKRQPFVNLLGFESPGSNVSGKGGGPGWSMPIARRGWHGAAGAARCECDWGWRVSVLPADVVERCQVRARERRVCGVEQRQLSSVEDWRRADGRAVERWRRLSAGARYFWARRGHGCRGAGDGVEAERVEALAELRPALEQAFAAGKPYVVECVVDGAV